jgi:hypothetical protein
LVWVVFWLLLGWVAEVFELPPMLDGWDGNGLIHSELNKMFYPARYSQLRAEEHRQPLSRLLKK